MTRSIRISEARELFAKNNGKPVHIHTIRRWIAKGIRRNGRPVRLKAEWEGSRLVTSPEWVAAFKQELSGVRTEPSEVTTSLDGPDAAELFLIAEGMYGKEAQEQMLGRRVRPSRRNVRTVPQVLSGGTPSVAKQRRDKRGTNRVETVEAAALST